MDFAVTLFSPRPLQAKVRRLPNVCSEISDTQELIQTYERIPSGEMDLAKADSEADQFSDAKGVPLAQAQLS